MNRHSIIDTDLNRYLAEQTRLDERAFTIDNLTGDISKDLLAGNHVHIGKDDWHFDDVLSKAFESYDFCMVCEALARTRGDREAFSNLSEEYQASSPKPPRTSPSSLLPLLWRIANMTACEQYPTKADIHQHYIDALIQGTNYVNLNDEDRFHFQRRLGIGGSDVAAILGLSPYRTAYEVWEEKTGRSEPDDLSDNDRVHFGNELEDVVAREYARRTGQKVQKRNHPFVHKTQPWLRANIDRHIVGADKGLECKTADKWAARDMWGKGNVYAHRDGEVMLVEADEKCPSTTCCKSCITWWYWISVSGTWPCSLAAMTFEPTPCSGASSWSTLWSTNSPPSGLSM
ncbi:hypothetical protein CS022_22280 [Veronia nyctiphanis]|uniref:YqaJ viral recombinase domain-containing protein n=1 Tax=Veronia nyctiphanis TaxID=1278244 RepID=A0A4Q0YNR2_9GAMM|nr:YqaJ viral recombinase family protein [Veronia nyctiphanis]RXJ70761.1 hypothetical protein CS022_22280 [Veronia nyctiphanis]